MAAVALLTSCSVPRQPADSRGVSFPERSASYLEEGSVVNPADVRLIQPGASKDQVRLKLGNPHFSERSEEHTSELQSLMRSSYAVFRSKKKTQTTIRHTTTP